MIAAGELRDLAKNTVTDIDYVMVLIQCKITGVAVEGDFVTWVTVNTRSLKDKANINDTAGKVVDILKHNGYEAEYCIFSDLEYEKYLRFKISWRTSDGR